MKRYKLGFTALSISACAVSATAQIAVAPGLTIGGVVDTGYARTTNTGTGTKIKSGAADSILGVSNIGFKGEKDFGEGVGGFFNFTIGFLPSSGKLSGGSDNLFSRNAYLGFKNELGSLSVGKQWNLNDDWLVGSVFKGGYNSGAVFKFSEFDAVSDIYNSTLKYVSPKVGDFQFAGMYGGSQSTTNGTLSNIGAKYSSGPLYVAGTVFTEKDGKTGAAYKLNTVGVSYAIDSFKPRLGYSKARVAEGSYGSVGTYAVATDANVINPGIDYMMTPKLTVSLDALKYKNTTASSNATVQRLLAVYAWRPDVSFVGNLAHVANSSNGNQSLVSLDPGATATGFSQTSLALGVIFKF